MSRFVLLHSCIWDSPDFKDEPFTEREAFMWMVAKAWHKPTVVRYKSLTLDLSRGQFACSRRDLANKWGWHDSKVGRFLKRLQKVGNIEPEANQGVCVITICNYEKYQERRTTEYEISEPEANQDRTTEQQSNQSKQQTIIEPKGSSPKPNGFDPSPFVEIWNSVCVPTGLPAVRSLTGNRRVKAVKRWREDFGGSIEEWGAYCQQIASTGFLTGGNDRNWRASFDWALEPRTVTRVLEGQYGNGQRRGGDPPGASMTDAELERKMRELGFD